MEQILETLRTEKKYLLNIMESSHMSWMLSCCLPEDPHNQSGGYTVRSLYFDTPDDADYWDKSDGYEMRRKLRLRVYSPDDSSAKLELKEKQGDLQRKRSLILPREDAFLVSHGDYSPLLRQNTTFSMELYSRMIQQMYKPKCIVEYDRRAFWITENDIRITLDSGLRSSLSNLELFDPELMLVPAGMLSSTVMEVKYNHFLLSYVKDLTSLSARTQTSVSKYCAARMDLFGEA